MNIESFLKHHGLTENPFDAEEARHDPVFERLIAESPGHPDFSKILGRIDRPSTAVVFGEKGSGKTAIRLLIGKRVAEHNKSHPNKRTLLVAYDDLNPVLDQIMARQRTHQANDKTIDRVLSSIRLEDHQDAILSLSVTKLINGLLDSGSVSSDSGEVGDRMVLSDDAVKKLRSLPRQQRADLALLAAMYDQPRRGSAEQRWGGLRSKLRLGRITMSMTIGWSAALLGIGAAACFIYNAIQGEELLWPLLGGSVLAAAAALLGTTWGWRRLMEWRLAHRITREVRVVHRSAGDLRRKFAAFRRDDTSAFPWPLPGNKDARYQLTNRLLGVLEAFGYRGIMVLVDRVDEPSLVVGKPERMAPIIWPMLDNKFLQQESVGLKLLLPVELRHALLRETTEFFQEARLDKQSLIDRLAWSGATLYDLATRRLNACREEKEEEESQTADGGEAKLALTDIFADDVTRQTIIDALDQMHQPRDAFKFLYSVIQEHCRLVADDEASYRIPRLVLDSVRRQQAQRVQDLYRGVSPA